MRFIFSKFNGLIFRALCFTQINVMLKESLFLRHLRDYALKFSPNIISYHETNGNYIYLNDRVLEFAGYEPEELIGRSPYDFIHPDDLDNVENAHQPLLKGLPVKSVKYRFCTRSGEYKWLDSYMIPVTENNIVSNLIGVSRDVAGEHDLKIELERQQKINEEVSEIANIGHWTYDIESGNVEWSKKIYEIYGIEQGEEMIFEKAMSFYNEESKEKINKAIEQAINTGKEYRLKASITNAHGEEKIVLIMGTPLIRKGRCTQLFGVFQDITETEKRSHHKIFTLSEYLNGQSQLLKEFSQVTSHDLRGPATSLKMLLDDFETNGFEKGSDLLPYFRENLDLLLNKINFLSKITGESNKQEIHDTINIHELLDQFELKNKDLLEEYDVEILREIIDWKEIVYDREKMERILQNVIENAIYYSDPNKSKKWVLVGAYIHNDNHELIIEDNGVGMNMEKFTWLSIAKDLDKNTSKPGGLFMTQILIEAEKGKLEIMSEPGDGTLVKIILDKFKFNPDLLCEY